MPNDNNPPEHPAGSRPQRVAIVGAGITGLAAAHRLVTTNPDVQVTVFEHEDRVGGIIQTVRRDGFLVELGPDSFITNKPGALRLAEEIGFSDQLIPTEAAWRRSLVLRQGKPMRVPDGFMLMAPAKPVAILTTPLLSWRGKMRLLAEAFVPRRKSSEDESLGSFVRRRFGRETLDRLVQPLVGGIYTSDPDKLSLQATLPRFPEMERRYGSVIRATLRQQRTETPDDDSAAPSDKVTSGSGARYGLFLSARDGLSSFMNAIADTARGSGRVTFQLKTRIHGVERSQADVTRNKFRSGAWKLRIGPVDQADSVRCEDFD
ncbi:MAG: protoporphyrinogen oxidase, partial [Planctomycetaceae bacterium]|nr:protoporphyrinogen oxidase [Planctomycetaceae bacterium]